MSMSIWNVIRFPFGALGAVAILYGCGINVGSVGVPAAAVIRNAGTHQKTFTYTGSEQTFRVPSGVTSITVDASGAAGATLKPKQQGKGGRVVAVVPVTPGQRLYIFVAGEGSNPAGGFNGGGAGGTASCGECTFGGGGASDVRQGGQSLGNRIVVAGGGGGLGYFRAGGGLGGTLVGGAGHGRGGSGGAGGGGGTQSQGGAGGLGGSYYGVPGSPGSVGVGGSGGGQNTDRSGERVGGGGGGGYYGGGGGGSGSIGSGSYPVGSGGGGGGGSSYAEPSATGVQMWQGWVNATGNGVIVFTL